MEPTMVIKEAHLLAIHVGLQLLGSDICSRISDGEYKTILGQEVCVVVGYAFLEPCCLWLPMCTVILFGCFFKQLKLRLAGLLVI